MRKLHTSHMGYSSGDRKAMVEKTAMLLRETNSSGGMQ